MVVINLVYKERLTFLFSSLMVIALFMTSYKPDILSNQSTIDSFKENIPWINAPAVLSLAMIGFILTAILSTKWQDLFNNFFKRKEFLFLSFTFIYLLTAFIHSHHYSYLFERLLIRLPFLLLPFAAASLILKKGNTNIVYFIFLACTLVLGMYTFGNYL